MNLALPPELFPSNEARIASLLALNDALFLALRQRFLALGAVSRSDTKSITLLAYKGALVLASHAAGLVLLSSVVDANEVAVASLLAKSALALVSCDRRG